MLYRELGDRDPFLRPVLAPAGVLEVDALPLNLVFGTPEMECRDSTQTLVGYFTRTAILNYHELSADVDEQERVMLELAAGQLQRDAFAQWLHDHVMARSR